MLFFSHLANQADLTREVSAQAFSKARKHFSHNAFAILNRHLMALVANGLTMPHWNGLHHDKIIGPSWMNGLKETLTGLDHKSKTYGQNQTGTDLDRQGQAA